MAAPVNHINEEMSFERIKRSKWKPFHIADKLHFYETFVFLK